MPTRIDKLTPEQEGQMAPWAQRWIGIGLQTGDADFETFERAIKVAYAKADIPFPNKIIRVQSPIVGALAASISRMLLQRHSPAERSEAVRSAVGSAVGSAVDSAVDSAVGSAVGSAVDSAVGSAVGSAVRSAVDSAVRSAVDSAVRSAVGSAVDSAVGSAVDSAVGSASLSWHDWFGGQFWVGWGWGWGWGSPSFVSFFTDVCQLELSPDIMERARAYRDICTSVNYFWPNTSFVMVCDRPQFIGRDGEGRLHNDQRKAIEYKDGWGLYALDGVVLQEGIWKQIVSQEMSFEEILEIPDADVRAVALKYNKNAIIASGAELIDEHPQFGELFLIKGKQINQILDERELYFMRMKCPTGRTFVECVEPNFARNNPHIIDCQANAFGVPVSVYRNLQPRNEG